MRRAIVTIITTTITTTIIINNMTMGVAAGACAFRHTDVDGFA
jgi:hypothetical protein